MVTYESCRTTRRVSYEQTLPGWSLKSLTKVMRAFVANYLYTHFVIYNRSANTERLTDELLPTTHTTLTMLPL